MKNEKYFVGLDIGTDSVGYAVTDEEYHLCKFKGEPMWGVSLFDPAQLAVDRRGFRSARRRLDRRQQRAQLIMDLFAHEISRVDENFYKRIKESYLYPANKDEKVRLFGSYDEQKAYTIAYPTIHHLICELMNDPSMHDVRLVYIACAWLVVHRGHFLSEVNKNNIDAVVDFKSVWNRFEAFITRSEYSLPWQKNVEITKVKDVLKSKLTVSKKTKELITALFNGGKAPKEINESYEYNYESVLKLLCGGKDSLKELFGKEEYAELEEKSLALNMEDEKIAAIMQSVDESDAEFISSLKAVYDWSVLVNILKGKSTVSEAKVAIYDQHRNDLLLLKELIRKYVPEKYDDVFRSCSNAKNYVAYIGKNKTANKQTTVEKLLNKKTKKDFCGYILSIIKEITPEECDIEAYNKAVARLEVNDFMPKQVDGDNRVIPYQLYYYELNKILNNAKSYIGFLGQADEDGITGIDKILSVMEFRVPYYVGPLIENKDRDRKSNHWMVRKAEGKIYPWNFEDKVDLDKSEEEFIARMTNSCTYLPGEDVLPKNSLIYSAFEVLNEINNIKVNGNDISVELKQNIYNDVFLQYDKVTLKRIKQYLISNGYTQDDVISGIDITVKSSLKPFRAFRNLVSNGLITYSDAENIINRATYSEDKTRFKNWLIGKYPHLPENDIRYIAGLKFKEFGRLSRKLLCGIEGAVNENTGEYMSIIRTMWETNLNFMQIITSDGFEFSEKIKKIVDEYYGKEKKSLSERLDEMYVSNAVKRPIIRTLDILKDIVKVQKRDPDTIFIEMARGANEDQKGRTKTRLDQIKELYKKVDTEDVRRLSDILEDWGDTAHNNLQNDKIFLYFIQLGKCLYTLNPINFLDMIKDDSKYNRDHIIPKCYVKDDSVINNLVLVDSIENKNKDDGPVPSYITSNPEIVGFWKYLNSISFGGSKLLSDEKLKRLMRTTPFTNKEKYEFINRQLVETRQSTKVIATLLKELYPKTEIVYVKARLVSDFRQKFDLLKSRAVNDLHHAKDAYLNIVVGNVWHHKFSKRYYIETADNNVKPEAIFTKKQTCRNNKVFWKGVEDLNLVKKTAKKNTAHITMYSYLKHSGQNGGFFDQNPKKAKEGLVPLKKDRPTDIYGGYRSATVTGFILVRYSKNKKTEVSFVPLYRLNYKPFIEDDQYAMQYIQKELGNKASNIEILLDKRIMKISTMLSFDGARFCIRSKATKTQIGLMNLMQFKVSGEMELYIKKLESFSNKKKKNSNIVLSEKYDAISSEKNIALYDLCIDKLQNPLYAKYPTNPIDTLIKGKERFENLSPADQADVILEILGFFGRAVKIDLSAIGGVSNTKTAYLSFNISNWKKKYTDVRIIDTSPSGLFEKVSDVNLLDLL